MVDDTNSTEITDHGALEYRAGNVLVDRAENDGAQWLDMSHDGYRSLYGIIHRRRLVAVARRRRPARRGHCSPAPRAGR